MDTTLVTGGIGLIGFNVLQAQRELGWQPTPFREGLRQTMAYLDRS
jgi:nucleoside-diphosphate-sugar epimerase